MDHRASPSSRRRAIPTSGSARHRERARAHAQGPRVPPRDGSTDGTPGISARYAASDARILTLRLEGLGVVAARNLAIQHLRGEYIAIMNSDDLSMQTEASVLAQIVARRRRRGEPDHAHARKRIFLRVFQIVLAPHEIVQALWPIGARYIRRPVVSRRRRRQLAGA